MVCGPKTAKCYQNQKKIMREGRKKGRKEGRKEGGRKAGREGGRKKQRKKEKKEKESKQGSMLRAHGEATYHCMKSKVSLGIHSSSSHVSEINERNTNNWKVTDDK
jgi:DNA invertase Pin-like site-specific DNA recombinase